MKIIQLLIISLLFSLSGAITLTGYSKYSCSGHFTVHKLNTSTCYMYPLSPMPEVSIILNRNNSESRISLCYSYSADCKSIGLCIYLDYIRNKCQNSYLTEADYTLIGLNPVGRSLKSWMITDF